MSRIVPNSLFALKEPTNPPKKGEVVNVVGVVGEWNGHPSGSFRLTTTDLQKIIDNFNALKRDIVVDYEHRTLSADEAPAAGWVKSLALEGDKLVAQIEWLDKAKTYINSGEYKYLSPVYEFNSYDAKTGAPIGVTLHSVALTNSPFLDELGEVKANKNLEGEQMSKELEAELAALKAEKEQAAATTEKLKADLAATKVANAIALKKVTEKQKEWALKYATQDPDGFAAYLETVEEQKEVKTPPANNLFPNKNVSTEAKAAKDLILAAATKQ
jgi:phage I-like protein